jgi:hypothetical protein
LPAGQIKDGVGIKKEGKERDTTALDISSHDEGKIRRKIDRMK